MRQQYLMASLKNLALLMADTFLKDCYPVFLVSHYDRLDPALPTQLKLPIDHIHNLSIFSTFLNACLRKEQH